MSPNDRLIRVWVEWLADPDSADLTAVRAHGEYLLEHTRQVLSSPGMFAIPQNLTGTERRLHERDQVANLIGLCRTAGITTANYFLELRPATGEEGK